MRLRWRLPLGLRPDHGPPGRHRGPGVGPDAPRTLLGAARRRHGPAGTAVRGGARPRPSPSADTLQALTEAAGDRGEVRLTLITAEGTVLADSEADPATLENHANRPEVAQALAGHEGRARRDSATLHEQMVYVAIPLPAGDQPWSGGALRAALSATRIDSMVAASWRIPLIVWAILLLPTIAIGLLALALAHQAHRPSGARDRAGRRR